MTELYGVPAGDPGSTPAASAADEVLRVARGVVETLDTEMVLSRVLEAARSLTHARYAALGVLDDSRLRLRRFITLGIDEAQREVIGPEPTGRGVLGELIRSPHPLRISDVGTHPMSYGFPIGHPQMKSFLGVPIMVAGRPYANLYLTEKTSHAEFTEADERALVLLVTFAGLAIDHAERYHAVESQRAELKRAVDTLNATVQIARATAGETDLDAILRLVAKRGRALVSARALVIEQRRGSEMVIAACAGELPAGLLDQSVDSSESLASAALRTGRTLRIEEGPNRVRYERHGLGRLGVGATAGLVVPLVFRGQGHGVLIAVDPLGEAARFSADDQRLLEAFATSAATAIAAAQIVDSEQRRQRLAAAEQERSRWARELHDQTLQSLAVMRLGLAAQLKAPDPEKGAQTMQFVVGQLESEIGALRALITELRPAALDELGIEGAVTDLAARASDRGLDVQLSLDLAYEQGRASERHISELETAVYRIVQEALTNAAKHSRADHVRVEIIDDGDTLRIAISDDGVGFDPSAKVTGFGVVGMRERAELLGGTIKIESAPGAGTTVRASFPALRRPGAEDRGPAGGPTRAAR